jgi:hypothetical protein
MNNGTTIAIDIKKLKEVTCTCGGTEFTNVMNLRLIPPLLSPTMKQEFAVIERWKCVGCGELIPIQFKKD